LSSYFIALINIHDPVRYEKYLTGYDKVFNKFNGKTDEENEILVEGWLEDFCERWEFDRGAWKMSAVKDRAKYIWGSENAVSSADLTGHCDWPSDRVPHTGYIWNYPEAAEMVSAATGENITNERMYDFIQRKRMVEMAYNILAEVLIGDFPEVSEAYTKLFSIDPKDGYFKGRKWNTEGGNEIVGEEYCKIRHLDPDNGVPLRGELERLGLYDVLQKLIENELIESDEDIENEDNINECLDFEKKSA
jgi:aldehyde:ferredoxin oxidoreductase